MVIEFAEQDSSAFDEVMEILKRHPGFEHLRLADEPMVSLPWLEIYPDRRKIYRDRREIRLMAKEYDLLSFLVANKGRVLTYDQIYQKVWGWDAYGDEILRVTPAISTDILILSDITAPPPQHRIQGHPCIFSYCAPVSAHLSPLSCIRRQDMRPRRTPSSPPWISGTRCPSPWRMP